MKSRSDTAEEYVPGGPVPSLSRDGSGNASGRGPRPCVVALDMGYGHLRAAAALARHAGVPIVHADRPPVASASEVKVWSDTRRSYEWLSRASEWRVGGRLMRRVLDGITSIPRLDAGRDLSGPSLATRAVERLARRGVGAGLVEHLRATGAPLVSTFYSPAVIAANAGVPHVHCVITDVDVHRVWVPTDPGASRMTYCVPALPTVHRLMAYGVPGDHILLTGFPLPPDLLGDRRLTVARRHLAARLARLDPAGDVRRARADLVAQLLRGAPVPDGPHAPPRIVFAVGGAGAQTGYAEALSRGLAAAVRAGQARLTLVAGKRPEVAERLRAALAAAGLAGLPPGHADVLFEPDFARYLASFHELLAATDVLWTKPSELTFYGALGLPLVFAPPLGAHERANRRWARRAGAGIKPGSPLRAASFLQRALADGTLAHAALDGFHRLPKRGTFHIVDAVDRPAERTG